MTRGLLLYYLNRDIFNDMAEDDIYHTMMVTNRDLIKQSAEEGYPIIFVVTVHEATRIEKVDFDKPFPPLEDEE